MKKAGTGDNLKRAVGRYAVDTYVRSGMRLGLGTGSTAAHAIHRLAECIREDTLRDIVAVPTSFQSQVMAQELGIPLADMNSPVIGAHLDIAIDGADEIDPERRLIKGGGAAHLLEKVVAYNAEKFIVVADQSKLVPHLGAGFPVPVEVVAPARRAVENAIIRLFGCRPELRLAVRKDGPVVTDQGNLVLDLYFEEPFDPETLEAALNDIPGVVENGIFAGADPVVLIAREPATSGEPISVEEFIG